MAQVVSNNKTAIDIAVKLKFVLALLFIFFKFNINL